MHPPARPTTRTHRDAFRAPGNLAVRIRPNPLREGDKVVGCTDRGPARQLD